MKNLIKAILCSFVLCALFSLFSFSCTAENVSEKVIRFHIPANSNSEKDQNIKIKVKDEIFLFVTDLLNGSESFSESKRILEKNIDVIDKKAEQILKSENAGYGAKVELILDYFKTRNYGTFTLPAGKYVSLKIDLGEGKGENWWCAVYPSICIPASSDFECFSDEEKSLILNDGDVEVRFIIYEWFLNIKNFFNI